jgi:hypothetical protein
LDDIEALIIFERRGEITLLLVKLGERQIGFID